MANSMKAMSPVSITPLGAHLELFSDDPFIAQWPTFQAYRSDWDRLGGWEATGVPDRVVMEFYAASDTPADALHAWFTYDDVTRHYSIVEALHE